MNTEQPNIHTTPNGTSDDSSIDRLHLLDHVCNSFGMDPDNTRKLSFNPTFQSISAIDQSTSIAQWLSTQFSIVDQLWRNLNEHENNVVREWSAIMIGLNDELSFARKLAWIKILADDAHHGLRDIAVYALRSDVLQSPEIAIRCLEPWTGSRNPNLRRFAAEITRPMGAHGLPIQLLIDHPELGLPIIEPLMRDESQYVRDSVDNWLRDAALHRPDWVSLLAT